MILKDKIALVTGGSSGIGLAIANALVQQGCQVIITCNTHKTNNPKFTEFSIDLHSEDQIIELFSQIKSKFKKIDILVNSAGINTPADQSDLNVWRDVFEINLFALVSVTNKTIQLMNDGGKIINISSVYEDGKVAWKGASAYSASKAAVSNFTQTLAKNLAPKINVNAIAPGYVKTPIWDKFSSEIINSSSEESLINRFITPDEIADMAVAIIRNDAMTGEIVVIDGGLSLKTI